MNGLDIGGDTNEQLNRLLVSVAEQQDRGAFQSLFAYFAPRLKAFALSRQTDHGMAEEIVQETMINVWRKAGQFDAARASASTWVFTIARNMRIDMLRKANRPEPNMDDPALVPDAEPPAHERISRKQEAARLKQALVGLPAEQQEILRMVFLDDTTHAEAAERLGIPLGTVKSRIRLALKRLRSEVGEEE